MYGVAKGMKDFDGYFRHRIGSGFSQWRVIYGHDGFAGELGHTIIEPNGRPCGCGRKGCLKPMLLQLEWNKQL